MKIAILADIHGVLPALECVVADIDAWQPDQVIVNGDVVNRGPLPGACWDFVQARRRSHGWLVNRGNHEDYVLRHRDDDTPPNGEPQAEINRLSWWTYHQLNGQVAELATLRDRVRLAGPDIAEVYVTHASLRGNRDAIWPNTPATEVHPQITLPGQPPPAAFVTAHIHVPFVRRVGETLLVNCGAVGQNCDGDTRASYARLTWQGGRWQAEVVRLAYDMAQAERDFTESGYFEGCGPVGRLVYHEWRTAQPLLYQWVGKYQEQVLAGEADLAETVERFLAGFEG